MRYAILAAFILISTPAFAQDSESFCRYTEESAHAQAIALEAPNAVAAVTPAQGVNPQLILGLTSGVNDIRRGRLTNEIAATQCRLYRQTTTVNQRLQYDPIRLNIEALENRLQLITHATVKLDSLITDNEAILAAGNIPRQNLYLLQKQRVTLIEDQAATSAQIAQLWTPHLSIEPLINLAGAEAATSTDAQQAQIRLQRLQNWNLAVSGGVEKPVSPFLTDPKGYIGVNFTYNLGDRAAARHDAAALAAFGKWQQSQIGGIQQQLIVARTETMNLIAAQSESLAKLRTEEKKIEANLVILDDSQTAQARVFRNELLADQIVLAVAIGDVSYRLQALQSYARENF